jgi:H+-transporting ATPase
LLAPRQNHKGLESPNSIFGQPLRHTAKLVQSAGAVSHFLKAVMQIGDFLIIVAVVLAAILIGVELMRGTDFLRLAEFVLILLVASVPVAMPAVLSVTMALSAQRLAKEKM